MKIVFFGTPQFAVPSLKSLLAHSDFEVAAVVTQPDKRRGRGGKVTPSPIKAAALEAGCPVWQPARIKKDPETLKKLDTPDRRCLRRHRLRSNSLADHSRHAQARLRQRARLHPARLSRSRTNSMVPVPRRSPNRRNHHANGCGHGYWRDVNGRNDAN